MEALTFLHWTFDTVTGLGLLWLAWWTLASPQLFRAIVTFVAFGLLMALAWVRLSAPDVALAEAAIGAGLTGALLMAALARLPAGRKLAGEGQSGEADYSARVLRWLSAGLLSVVAVVIGYVILSFPSNTAGLSIEVAANLENSGVGNPVTAVLLNFRGYDTFLEIVVLLLALLGVWSLGGLKGSAAVRPGPVLETLVRVLTPLSILLVAYLLWAGARAPGGAFPAGAVLGAAGVMLLLAGWRPHSNFMQRPLRLILALGPCLFLAIASVSTVMGRHLLEYPPEQAGIVILGLEIAAALSIGATLAALFMGERPRHDGDQ